MEFGELNILASRAFWDDYENVDGDQPTESIEVQWKWSKNHSVDDFKNLKTLIILEGERIRSQINPDNVIPICQLSHQKVFVFLLKQNDVAICLSEETNLNTFGIVAESIAELLAHAGQEVNVVTVNVLPISSYKIGAGESFDADVIIRGINAETSKTSSRVSELMEPNILTGISAAVASHRHHLNKSFSSYAVYKDSHKTNFIGSPRVIQFFEAVGISSDIFYETYANESSLYT